MRFLFFFIIFVSALPLSAKTVCLNMIVKNERTVIKRCLDSVKPLIDYWVIVDTGSTDGTQKAIKKQMRGTPGELHERPWKNFGHNRTEALELAKGKADYILFMDADDWLEYETGYQLPPLTLDAYQVCFTIENGSFSYLKPHLINGDLPWKWEGVMHEYVTVETPHSTGPLEGVRYIIGGDGARSNDPEKYLKCAKILEEALEEEPENVRYTFYLAESYRDAGLPEKALEWYEKRAKMGGWEAEIYLSLLQIGKLQTLLGYDRETIIESLYKAHRFSPHRSEAIYYLAEQFNQGDRHDLAYECLKGKSALPTTAFFDVLFKEDWIDQWGLLFQLSICSFYLGQYEESLEACDRLLTMELPEAFRERVVLNRPFPLQKLRENNAIALQPLPKE